MGEVLRSMGIGKRAVDHLFAPIDNAPLIAFRILFGALLAIECEGQIATYWAEEIYIRPEFTFPMFGWNWLQPLPGLGMIYLLMGMTLLGVFVMIGAWFRTSLGLFTILWAYSHVCHTTGYNNHHYLMGLLCALLWCTPANARASWDARWRPEIRSLRCPRWCVWMFIAQVAIVYFYATVAKLYPDWFAGRPVDVWFNERAGKPVVGWLLAQEWWRSMVVWGGIAFDGLIVPLLLWKRTRLLVTPAYLFFHLFNSITFEIGVFPYLAIGFLVFFYEPQTVARWFRLRARADDNHTFHPTRRRRLVLVLLTVYFTLQVLLPLRHHLYPGDVHWTEEAHRFSWLMMTRSKRGSAIFYVDDPATGRRWRVQPALRLPPRQAFKVAGDPYRLWIYAQRLAEEFRPLCEGEPRVRVHTAVRLNGHPPRQLVDPNVDLAAAPYSHLWPSDWILRSP